MQASHSNAIDEYKNQVLQQFLNFFRKNMDMRIDDTIPNFRKSESTNYNISPSFPLCVCVCLRQKKISHKTFMPTTLLEIPYMLP